MNPPPTVQGEGVGGSGTAPRRRPQPHSRVARHQVMLLWWIPLVAAAANAATSALDPSTQVRLLTTKRHK